MTRSCRAPRLRCSTWCTSSPTPRCTLNRRQKSSEDYQPPDPTPRFLLQWATGAIAVVKRKRDDGDDNSSDKADDEDDVDDGNSGSD